MKEYNLSIIEALYNLINSKVKYIEKQDGNKYKLLDGVLVSTHGYIPAVIDISDKWRVIR